MSFLLKGHYLRGFKWPWRNKLNLDSALPISTPLLNDVSIEIELSEYQRLPTPGNESPSGLLNGYSPKNDLIYDLDIFFGRLYEYYCAKGLSCIIIQWTVEIFIVVFMVCFIGFFFLMVDWDTLLQLKCGADALELGQKACDLSKVVKDQPLVPFTYTKMIIVGSIILLITYGTMNFLKFFMQLKSTLGVRDFYLNSLRVTDHEMLTTPWPQILEKVVRLQRSRQLCVVRDLSEHDIIMRIMRKENYLIGMVNKGILAFPVPSWLPGVGPTVNSRVNRKKCYLILPKALEWTLNWCIFQSMFDSKFCVRKDFLTSPSFLKKKLRFMGILMLLLCPMLVIFPLVYLFLRHAEQFYNDPSTASSRRWSNLSKWALREFNEVQHFFKHRMNNGAAHALNYLKQFPAPLISIIAKFISFVSGGMAGILLIAGLLDESILEGHVFGRNLLWYAAVFGAITAISRTAVSDELQVFDPEGAMKLVVDQTHYMPKRWRGKEGRHFVRKEFETLFQYYGMMLLEEMASILVTPYLLIFVVPMRVDDILQFISDFTVYVDGVGDICSLSLFDFERHGNKNYGSPFNATKEMRSSQGKMEKSFFSFQSTYPSWEPDTHGKELLAKLQKFQDRQINEVNYAVYSRNSLSQSARGPRDGSIGRVSARDVNLRTLRMPSSDQNLGSLVLSNVDGRLSSYLLDWFYCSHRSEDDVEDPLPSQTDIRPVFGGWQPPRKLLYGIEEDDAIWGNSMSERAESHMMASTSTPFLQEDTGNQQSSEQHRHTHWWNRSRPSPQPSGPHDSFVEPPDYGLPYTAPRDQSRHGDAFLGRSREQVEQSDGLLTSADCKGKRIWLSKTFNMDESSDYGQDAAELTGATTQRRHVGSTTSSFLLNSGDGKSGIANYSEPNFQPRGIYMDDDDLGQHSAGGRRNIEVFAGSELDGISQRRSLLAPWSPLLEDTVEGEGQQPLIGTMYIEDSDDENPSFHFAD